MYGHLLTIQIKFLTRFELEKRLIEEMREMNNTCSSGYLTRFANYFFWFF